VVNVPVRKGVSAFLARRRLGQGKKLDDKKGEGEKMFLVD